MKNKFMSMFTLFIVLLLAVSCIQVTEDSYLDAIRSITMASNGHVKSKDVYYVYAGDATNGRKLKSACIVDGYYSSGMDININEKAAVYAVKTDGSVITVTDSTVIKPGEEYTLYAGFNGLVSNRIKVIGVAANQILEASSNNNGIYLKGAKIEDMGTMTLCYYTESGSFFYSSGVPLYTKDKDGSYYYQVKQLDANKKELANGELTSTDDTDNTLLADCKYLSVSRNGTTSVLIPVTEIIDLSTSKNWEVGLSGGYYKNTEAGNGIWCNTIVMNIYNKGKTVRLKNLSKRSDDSSIVTITRNDSGEITSSKLNDGWEIVITRNDSNSTSEVGKFNTAGEDVKVNLTAGEYTFTVRCTNPEKYGLPSGITVEGSHTFTVVDAS